MNSLKNLFLIKKGTAINIIAIETIGKATQSQPNWSNYAGGFWGHTARQTDRLQLLLLVKDMPRIYFSSDVLVVY